MPSDIERARAAMNADLPDSVAQEAGEFYQSYAALNPNRLKRDAMRHAWEQVIRPYLTGLRDHSPAQRRPEAR